MNANSGAATTRRRDKSFTRRQWIGAGFLGAGLARACYAWPPARRIIDSHVHLWKLPRTAPPMSDFATFPTGCCGSAPWMEMDRLTADYAATAGGPKVEKVVLIESSVGVPPDKIMQSNLWMLQTAAADAKILSVVGNLDVKQPPASFGQQLAQLSANKRLAGLRIGAGIFDANVPQSFATIRANVMENLTLLAKLGLEIDALGIRGAVLSQIGAAAPGLTIVMDHFAGKPATFDVEDSWKADMLAAARCPGLNIKVSDVHKLSQPVSQQPVTKQPVPKPGEIRQAARPSQFQPVPDPSRYAPTLEFLWNTFGPDRLIFGTNWPVSDAGGLGVDSIDLQIGILESFLSGQHAANRDKVMYQNALRVYGPHT